MKTSVIIPLLLLFLTGCVSSTTPTAIVPLTTAQTVAGIVEPLAQGAVPLILDKNPSYASAVAIVADAIPAALATGNLSAETIGAAITSINSRAALGLAPDVQTIIANALSISVVQYQQRMGLKLASATDPGIQLILQSFATGIHNGVATWQAAHK